MRKFIAISALAIISACVSSDPEAAAERRQALIQQIFPALSDQQGIGLVFPIESGGFYSSLEIIYYKNEVSESEIIRRTSNYCAAHTGNTSATLKRRGSLTEVPHSDGTKHPAAQIWLSCFN